MKTATTTLYRALPQVLQRQRGASLLEGIAYLGIAAIVVLGAVSLLTTAFGSAKTNQATEEIVALRTAVRKLYAGQAYPAASLLPSMIAAKSIPNTLVVAGAVVNNTFGGTVTVTGAATSFNMVYSAVPQDVCVGMISGANGWQSISTTALTITTFPATAANATTACSVAAAAGNTITFTAS